jgi:hypothetical protein
MFFEPVGPIDPDWHVGRVRKIRFESTSSEDGSILLDKSIRAYGQDAMPPRKAVVDEVSIEAAVERDPFSRDFAVSLVEVPEQVLMVSGRTREIQLADKVLIPPQQHMVPGISEIIAAGRQGGELAFLQRDLADVINPNLPRLIWDVLQPGFDKGLQVQGLSDSAGDSPSHR